MSDTFGTSAHDKASLSATRSSSGSNQILSAAPSNTSVDQSPANPTQVGTFANLSLPELYQRRLAMLRELHTLEDAIKAQEAQQSESTASASGSLAAAIDGRIKALKAETVDESSVACPAEDGANGGDGQSLDEQFKETIKKNAALLVQAYDKSSHSATDGVFIPPVDVVEAVQRSSVAFILNLIKKGTNGVSGLKECNKIAEIACGPVGFAKEEVPRITRSNDSPNHDSLIRYFTLLVRLHFRQLFIAETILHARHLINDAKGNALMQRAIPLMVSGTVEPSEGSFWYTSVLSGEGSDISYQATNKAAHLWDPEVQLAHVHGKGTASELLLLIASLGSTLAESASHTNGTRAILKISESMKSVRECVAFMTCIEGGDVTKVTKAEESKIVVPTLTSRFITLLIDMNGNSVLNKVLCSNLFTATDEDLTQPQQDVMEALRKQVYGIMTSMCLDVCRNRQGCCTIQRCIVNAPEPYKQAMVDVVLANALKLVQDPFGNYVIQFLLDSGVAGPDSAKNKASSTKKQPSKYTNLIIRQLLHHIPALSTNKFSSNVIEKCLKNASADVRQLLIDELTDPQALAKLLVDSYANYVIQTAIESVSDELQFKQIRDAIMPLQHLLKNSPYGGKIESRLERRQKDIHSQKRMLSQGSSNGQGGNPWGNRGTHQRNPSNTSGNAVVVGGQRIGGQSQQRNRGEDMAAPPLPAASPSFPYPQPATAPQYQRPFIQPYHQQDPYAQPPPAKSFQQPNVAVAQLQQPFMPATQQGPYTMQPVYSHPPQAFGMQQPTYQQPSYVSMGQPQPPPQTYMTTQPLLQMPPGNDNRSTFFLNPADGHQQPQQHYFYAQ